MSSVPSTASMWSARPFTMPDSARPAAPALLFAAVLWAVAGPALLAWNEPPSSTFLNQALALSGWCVVVMVLARWLPPRDLLYRGGLGLLWWALGLLVFAALMSPVWAGLPWGLSLSATGVIVIAGLVASAGAAVSQARRSTTVFRVLAWGLVLAGLASSVVAAIQLFAPAWADGAWIARSTVDGRAVGNLRQANHLASLLLWSAVAAVWLAERRLRRAQVDQAFAPTVMDTRAQQGVSGRALRLSASERERGWVLTLAAIALVAFVAGVVFSGSRTGLVGTGLLALWGLVDRRLSNPGRALLLAAPVIALGVSWALASGAVGAAGGGTGSGAATILGGGGLARSGSDISSSRFGIWSNTLTLVAQNPWLGVGFGEFNFAWTLTPFPDRPIAFFDHTHNLPLHLLVELGIPLGLIVMGFLLWTLWRAWRQVKRHDGEHGVTVRAAFVMVLLMVVHSQLEYPLWYAHFLLPTAFALGLCIAGTERRSVALRIDDAGRQPPVRTMLMAGLLGLAATGAAVWDYQRVADVFRKPEPGLAPLAQRIADGRLSWFFAHHADYAAVTTAERPSTFMPAFDRAAHHLLDARLMKAWAQALDETNQVDRSRHLAQRLAEFRNPLVADFFAVCALAPSRAVSPNGTPPSGGMGAGSSASPPASASRGPGAQEVGSAPGDSASSGASAPRVQDGPARSGSDPAASGPRASARVSAGPGRAASWVEMAASFPAPVSAAELPRGPPSPPPDPAFVAPASADMPFQCLKPRRVLSFQDFR
jgi:O-antigen ligase